MSRFSERQIVNALRYGLCPDATHDVQVTPTTFPNDPAHLGPGVPWFESRHMADDDL